MIPKLNRKFPSTYDMEQAALRRMPKFMADYVSGGMGLGLNLRRNRETLDAVRLMPRYLVEDGAIDLSVSLFGQTFGAPFGVAPVGNGGSVWPGSAEALAREARDRQQPFGVSTVAVSSLEKLKAAAGDMGWFQLYRPNVPEIEADVLRRAKEAGYKVLMVTVDVPDFLRRDHDIRNNFGSEFSLTDPATFWQLLTHPSWTYASWRHGMPKLETLLHYAPAGRSARERDRFVFGLLPGHVGPEDLRRLRENWDGILLAKGILDPAEAALCQSIGLDGVVVSNHGGRQLEAAPSAIEVLPAIRRAVGPDFTLIADGGVRTGLDICRMLAVGADFVLIGRAFYYAMGAMGLAGAPHVFDVLTAELRTMMGQLGVTDPRDLPERLITSPELPVATGADD
ncbi:MAG: alpha-hydroxy acid oxidase [Pseudomonadota bacterium]|nr:alpha-hydroxy acid oxidase [Pseudomonadota bacterium]